MFEHFLFVLENNGSLIVYDIEDISYASKQISLNNTQIQAIYASYEYPSILFISTNESLQAFEFTPIYNSVPI